MAAAVGYYSRNKDHDLFHYGLTDPGEIKEIKGDPVRILDHSITKGLSYYKSEPEKIKTSVHWGQRKLFISELEFFTKYLPEYLNEIGSLPPKLIIDVLYVGAAPGYHVPLLALLVNNLAGKIMRKPNPDVQVSVCFHLYDPNEFVFPPSTEDDCEWIQTENGIPKTEGSPDKTVFIYQKAGQMDKKGKFFEDGDLAYWKTKSSLFLISDIRTKSSGKTPSVMDVQKDMETQKRWWLDLNPVASSFKFRLPWTTAEQTTAAAINEEATEYMKGDIYYPVWGLPTTTESRLFVRQNAGMTNYYHQLYENQMYTFHQNIHHSKHVDTVNNLTASGMDQCYDCASEHHILDNYLNFFIQDDSEAIEKSDLISYINGNCYYRLNPRSIQMKNTLAQYAWEDFGGHLARKGRSGEKICIPFLFNTFARKHGFTSLTYFGCPIRDLLTPRIIIQAGSQKAKDHPTVPYQKGNSRPEESRIQPAKITIKDYEQDILRSEYQAWKSIESLIRKIKNLPSREIIIPWILENLVLDIASKLPTNFLNPNYNLTPLVGLGDEEMVKLSNLLRSAFSTDLSISFSFLPGNGLVMDSVGKEINCKHPMIETVKKCGYTLAARLVIRYEAIREERPWISNSCFRYLRDNGVRLDCFGNVFGSSFCLDENLRYCGYFPNLEQPFGCINSFLLSSPMDSIENNPLTYKDWFFHPPINHPLIDRALEKLTEYLSNPEPPTVYGIVHRQMDQMMGFLEKLRDMGQVTEIKATTAVDMGQVTTAVDNKMQSFWGRLEAGKYYLEIAKEKRMMQEEAFVFLTGEYEKVNPVKLSGFLELLL
jgi:hypothetical protein